jgi:predicted nucleotidyltransferase
MSQETQALINKFQDISIKSYMQSHNIKHIWLAGSFSRWQQNDDSDIDILYEEKDTSTTDLEILGMPQVLQERLGKTVDMLYRHGLNRYVKDSLLHDSILIW